MRSVFVAADSTHLHRRRTCAALVARHGPVEAIADTSRRLRMFDPCPICAGGIRRSSASAPAGADPLRDRAPSTRERVRAEAIRRGVTYHEWATRFAAQAEAPVIDLVAAERVLDLTARSRQSESVTS